MIEIRWHGRGGQGAFTASRLLAASASLYQGMYALAFPSFGPERRGARVQAFYKNRWKEDHRSKSDREASLRPFHSTFLLTSICVFSPASLKRLL